MPKNPNIKKVLVIGSGPIVIGQAAEFDYAGTQACRALKQEGLEVILINSNPATIMTDNAMADKIYIEPLTLETVKRVIKKERPDSLLSTLGGQTGLTLSMQLAKEGFLDKYNVKLLGANPETIDKAEDRQMFKDTMESIGQPCIPSKVVNTVEDAVDFANQPGIGYPLIIRPAFTLGGTGGGIVNDEEELKEITRNGLYLSPITQVLVEKCIAGWKEIEFEVMRDAKGNVITVCSMENFDPVGVHTGDSIVIAPAVTLADKEYQMLRSAALKIIDTLKVEGGCNCQFALNPDSFEYAVIEVNPRVSRSSALASKATGYPIAKVAAQIAIGYTLDEIKNAVTGKTYACFEPALDYVVVKLPKWPFDKFVYAKRELGTQMKATGEVMAIGSTFEQAIMKAVRGAEIGHDCLISPKMLDLDDKTIHDRLSDCTDERLFVVYEALRRGVSVDEIHSITKIDEWFLYKLCKLIDMEKTLKNNFNEETYLEAKKIGYTDKVIEKITGKKIEKPIHAVFKMVDTCAAEFAAMTPYFYSTYDNEDEASEFIANRGHDRKTVIVFGSGPIRIGQGIEFDYCCVHASLALREDGYETIMVNCNPETVSTDYDTSDRLYFEPVTLEDVLEIVRIEKPKGVIVQYGGQTPLKLARALEAAGVPVIGTSPDAIDRAEDRERFQHAVERLKLKQPANATVTTIEMAVEKAKEIGYPLVVRPSYVLGGRAMEIVYDEADLRRYFQTAVSVSNDAPVLLDHFLDDAVEVDVDAICDGEMVLIGGIMEHIEQAGVHSGDSACSLPAYTLSQEIQDVMRQQVQKLAFELQVRGLMNVQFAVKNNEVYLIEVNPRAARTVPFVSKATGVPLAKVAARVMAGKTLAEQGVTKEVIPPYYSVKEVVLPFNKFPGVDPLLGPEMRSTGEVMGVGRTFAEAFAKAQLGSNSTMKKHGRALLSVREGDKERVVDLAAKLLKQGFELDATHGTAIVLGEAGINPRLVNKVHEGRPHIQDRIKNGEYTYIINTTSGRRAIEDSRVIRRSALQYKVHYDTTLNGGFATAMALNADATEKVISVQEMHAQIK